MGKVLGVALGGVAVVALTAGLGWISLRNMRGTTAHAATPATPAAPVGADTLRAQTIARGAHLMVTLGCNDCHTPHDKTGKPIAALAMSGHPADAPLPEWDPSLLERNILVTISPTLTAFAGPFGVSIAPNLTPDKETGIGNTTAEQLIASWRTGKHWAEDRPVLPPMPIQGYMALSDDDIRALHAYLMSQPPIKNRAPASRLAPSAG